MAINHTLMLGENNLNNYLHITIAKMVTPSVVAWETWIPLPFTNYTLVVPVPDPDVYYITFYEAPDNVSLGDLKSQAFFNALSPEYAFEYRWYEFGNLPVTATLDVTQKIITDTYLIGKTVVEFVKEAFRPLEPTADVDFDNTTGDITLLTGATFEDGEKFMIVIKYAVGTVSSSSSGGLYTGTLNVTAATYTLLVADKNKRVRCVGSAATQVLTGPSLSTLSVDDGYFIDNSCGGVAVQVKFLIDGGDRIRYNGFMEASNNEYAEFWISKGEILLIRKFDDDYWEVILTYEGVRVGERMSGGLKSQAAWMPEDGSLSDGDEFSRVWWYINNLLPSTHVITDDAVTGSYTHPAGKEGMFVKHSTLKKFRWPNTQGLSERGLKNFNTYGSDTDRVYDYPGGVQNAQVGEFTSNISVPKGFSYTGSPNQLRFGNGSNNPQNFSLPFTANTGLEQRVKNTGVIYMRHI